VSFLFRNRGSQPDERPAEPPPAAPEPAVALELAPVEFFTADDHMVGTIDAGHERVTDQLNRDGAIAILAPEAEGTWLESAPVEGTKHPDWVSFDVGEVLLVVPPPQQSDPQRRLHRPRQPIDVRIGRFAVSGSVHVPPGAQASGYLYRVNPHFVPVTEAVIRSSEPDPFERRDAVVLVNLRRVERIEGAGVVEPTGVPDAGPA